MRVFIAESQKLRCFLTPPSPKVGALRRARVKMVLRSWENDMGVILGSPATGISPWIGVYAEYCREQYQSCVNRPRYPPRSAQIFSVRKRN